MCDNKNEWQDLSVYMDFDILTIKEWRLYPLYERNLQVWEKFLILSSLVEAPQA